MEMGCCLVRRAPVHCRRCLVRGRGAYTVCCHTYRFAVLTLAVLLPAATSLKQVLSWCLLRQQQLRAKMGAKAIQAAAEPMSPQSQGLLTQPAVGGWLDSSLHSSLTWLGSPLFFLSLSQQVAGFSFPNSICSVSNMVLKAGLTPLAFSNEVERNLE